MVEQPDVINVGVCGGGRVGFTQAAAGTDLAATIHDDVGDEVAVCGGAADRGSGGAAGAPCFSAVDTVADDMAVP